MPGGTRYLHSIWNRYLQIFRKAGIVKSIKGSQGGYFLSRPPQEITVSSIIEALEGDYRIEDKSFRKKENIPGVSKQSRNW